MRRGGRKVRQRPLLSDYSACMVPLQAAAAAAALAAVLSACQPAPALALIIRGGSVFDGTGVLAQRLDIGIKGDRIAAFADRSGQQAGHVIDATGLAVAPGFIDVQGQSGTTLVADGNGERHLRQ